MDRQPPMVLEDLPSVSVSADASGSPDPSTSSEVETLEPRKSAVQPVAWLPVWALVIGLSAVFATIGLLSAGGRGRGLFIELLCFLTLLLAAGFDSATGHIPNPITYTGILLGLSLNCVSLLFSRAAPALADHWYGAAGPTQSLMGFLILGGIGVFCRAVAGLGGGDMKLLAAVGALLGCRRATNAMVAALVVAVVYALANLFTAGRLNAAARSFFLKSLAALYPHAALPEAAHRSRTFPLAIPMFLGLLLSALPSVAAATAWVWGM